MKLEIKTISTIWKFLEPYLPPWACRLRANRWIHGVSPSTPAAAISLPEASFHEDGDNQSDVWHLPSSWCRPCHAARPSQSQRRFRYCRPRDPSGSTSTPLQHHGVRAQVDRVLPDRAFAVRRFNGENLGHNDGHFRCPSGIGARPDPLYRILCRSHWHRGAARLQRARFCRWLTGLRERCAARSCSPGHADVHMHRKRQSLDEFQPTSSQPFEDGADMVGLQPSSAPLQQYRNEGVRRRPSTRCLCPRSGSPHRQWDDAGETRQPHFGCLLIPAPTITNHPSIPHLGRCSCSGTRTHTYAYRLLQRAPRFLSASSDW